MMTRPLRSMLYIPGSHLRALEKSRSLPTDAIIFDLEDAVSVEEKEPARETLRHELARSGWDQRFKLVRINGLETEWGQGDARAVRHMKCDAVLLPKVESAAQIDALADITGDLPVWAMMETPLGILNAREIAAHPKLGGMVVGTNDLMKEMHARYSPDRAWALASLGLVVLAAKAFKKPVIDGVYNAFKDEAGLAIEAEQGRDMGFDGKSLIHPAQLEVANAVFAPTKEEVDLARRQIAAFEEARANGQGVAVVDGKIVENLHVDTARAVLAKAKVIDQIRIAAE